MDEDLSELPELVPFESATGSNEKSKMKCPLCEFVPKKALEIPIHLTEKHDIRMEIECMAFQTEDDFYSWKILEELRTCSNFYKIRGTKRKKTGSIVSDFKCYRSGRSDELPPPRKTNKWKKNLEKINGTCPAYIKMTLKEGGEIDVVYLKTHVGHENAISRLPKNPKKATKSEKTLLTGTSLKKTIETIENRNSYSKRRYQLSPDSIKLIQSYYNKLGDNPAQFKTLEEWLSSNHSCILFYKREGVTLDDHKEMKSDDFVLIIMNEPQKEILKTYGNNIIYLQRSRKVNILGYELFSLVALDDFNCGYPCAFLITNQCNRTNLTLFFTKIHEQLGNFSPKFFISDVDDIFCECWVEVMNSEDLKRLYCRWDVVEDWTLNLTKFVNIKEKIVDIFKELKTLLVEESTGNFNRVHKRIVDVMMRDPKAAKFGEYFYEKYSTNSTSWAYCVLKDTPLENLPSQIDVLNNLLIHLFLHIKNYNNLGRFIQDVLNNFLKGTLIDRLLVIDEKKLRKYLITVNERHRNAEQFPEPLVTRKTCSDWMVTTKNVSKINCTVREICKDCDCRIFCVKCKTCIHRYVCSCTDSKGKWNMCKHIHLVCMFRNNEENEDSEQIGEHDYFKATQEPPEAGNSQQFEDNVNEIQTEDNDVNDDSSLEHVVSSPMLEDLDLQKETLKNNFQNILNYVNCEEDLDVVRTHLESIFSVLTDDH